ncbi:lytic transglycosylase domain-containing protein, partial [Xenorhabdus bovienii]|nr:lytic transglycosylase domain-containing protein [Xenorhabdus bovienii]
MAKPWRDVVTSPQYQSLNPQQQAAAQEQYFSEVVAPKAGDKVEAARQQFYTDYPLPQQQQAGNPIAEAGKGFLQAGVNVANIIPSIGDAVVSAGAWAGEKAGLGDGTYTPASRFELPDNLKPQDTYAKIGSEVAPYLIPGIG